MSDFKRDDQIIEVDKKTGRVSVSSVNNLPSLTQQHFADECDINHIMAKYERTGMVNHLSRRVGRYGDFSNIEDYQTMLHRVSEAQESFAALPADLRRRFDNDPGLMIDFLSKPENIPEAISLGLIDKPKKTNELNDQKTDLSTIPPELSTKT